MITIAEILEQREVIKEMEEFLRKQDFSDDQGYTDYEELDYHSMNLEYEKRILEAMEKDFNSQKAA